MDSRLKKHCDINRYFLESVSNLQECLLEAQKVQNSLIEITELKEEFSRLHSEKKIKFDCFMADKRTTIKQILDKNSIKNVTKEVLDDRVISHFTDDYQKLKTDLDEAELNLNLCQDLKFILMQRKDIISETISYMKSKFDHDSCIFNNQKFMDKVLSRV